jgi:hypothetical protein
LSGTLTKDKKTNQFQGNCAFKILSLLKHHLINQTSVLKKRKKVNVDVQGEYENVIYRVCDELYQQRELYLVTLILHERGIEYLNSIFGVHDIYNSNYKQDSEVINETISEFKKKDNPRILLVLTTSISGMGFDPSNLMQVIHTCPPRDISQYFQEVVRAGRRGQPA